MNDEAPALVGRCLTHTFGQGEQQTVALRDVSLDLLPGQITLLMGPSGSGKSTLLSVLSGLLHPDAGDVTVLNTSLWGLSDRERERFRLEHSGFIFQGYNLFPALTARQQLEIVLRWGQGMSHREARRQTDEMLALLGMGKKGHLRPGQLSGGEKQRVAFGRALIKKPAFCFADEPTSALDWGHGETIVELLRAAAHDQGATILVVSHDGRIIPFADQVYHLHDGVLEERQPAQASPLQSVS